MLDCCKDVVGVCCFLYDLFRRKPKALVVGLKGSGKITFLLQQSFQGRGIDNVPDGGGAASLHALQFRFVSFSLEKTKDIALRKKLCQGTSYLIVVVDSTERKKLPRLRNELCALLHLEELSHVPILIYANKQDQPRCVPKEEILQTLALPTSHHWHIQPCSFHTREGLDRGCEWLLSKPSRG